MSMGARYGAAETFLVKPPECGPSGHPQSHFEQPNMMKIVMRHYVRVRLLPILKGIYDTQCAFKCFRATDLMSVIKEVRSIGADFDMELLLCALSYFKKGGGSGGELCVVKPTLFTEDFAESNFMASVRAHFKPLPAHLQPTTCCRLRHSLFRCRMHAMPRPPLRSAVRGPGQAVQDVRGHEPGPRPDA